MKHELRNTRRIAACACFVVFRSVPFVTRISRSRCVILAIVLVLLCICTLWRKRRQLCWGSSGNGHSEGDSAGSCYLPPQYSRCSSFHHAPPPYTEVRIRRDARPQERRRLEFLFRCVCFLKHADAAAAAPPEISSTVNCQYH